MKKTNLYRSVVDYWQNEKETNNEVISSVLDEIEKNPSIPCTQDNVAKKAAVSKSSIRNRVWACNRIKQIKTNRKKAKRIEKLVDQEKKLSEKKKNDEYLNNIIVELHYWYSKSLHLEEELMSIQNLYDLQKEERITAQAKLEAIEEYLSGLGVDPIEVLKRKLN